MTDVDAALARARADVVRDLGPRAGAMDDVLDAAVDGRRWWLTEWPDGAPYALCLLAQDVQEAVHPTDPLWPACTEATCPELGTHPLLVEPDLGSDPFWVCHHTGLPVAAVGQLPT